MRALGVSLCAQPAFPISYTSSSFIIAVWLHLPYGRRHGAIAHTGDLGWPGGWPNSKCKHSPGRISPQAPLLYATITLELQTCYLRSRALLSLYFHSYAPYNTQLSFVVELDLTVNSSPTPQIRPTAQVRWRTSTARHIILARK
jgi:hypothetical protein